MSIVYEEGENKCPVCGSMNTGFDLDCNTNEQELDCHDCHYAAHTRIVERPSGKLFWEVVEQFPMDENGNVRRRPSSVLNFSGEPINGKQCNCLTDESCEICDPRGFRQVNK